MKKLVTRYCFLISVGLYPLYPSQLIKQSYDEKTVDNTFFLNRQKEVMLVNGYCERSADSYVTEKIRSLIFSFALRNIFEYTGNPLPESLCGKNLTGYNFKGCRFMYTNLRLTTLDNTILIDTTCDYQKAFEENYEKNGCQRGAWAKRKIMQELKSITEVYPKLNIHEDKVALLRMADRLSRLPSYKEKAFRVKWQYLSCDLLTIKDRIGEVDGKQLFSALKFNFKNDLDNCCWTTNYPQDKINIHEKSFHDDFSKYLNEFRNASFWHVSQTNHHKYYGYYREEISNVIIGLDRAYSNIHPPIYKKKACKIARDLSKSYQLGGKHFLYHYLFYQSKLVDLKRKTKVDEIYYSPQAWQVANPKYEWK